MKKYWAIIQSAEIFKEIDTSDLETMLSCLETEVKMAQRGEIILLAGDKPMSIGMVLDGLLHVIRDDYEGNRALIAAIKPGELFAEALCCAGVSESPVTVIADTDSEILLMNFSRVLHTCSISCNHHTKLIANMLELIAGKNLLLQNRMEIVSLKSVRAKVMRFLESFSAKKGRSITIPFNREQMSNFLCVDRSALSHELMRMKNEGLIEYRKNNFLLK